MATHHHQRRRVRVITDRRKYWRHQLKKSARRVLKIALWAGAIAVCVLGIWLVLDMLFRLRPLPQ
jgi:hypothetical protein